MVHQQLLAKHQPGFGESLRIKPHGCLRVSPGLVGTLGVFVELCQQKVNVGRMLSGGSGRFSLAGHCGRLEPGTNALPASRCSTR
jgi:hypothetical protein